MFGLGATVPMIPIQASSRKHHVGGYLFLWFILSSCCVFFHFYHLSPTFSKSNLSSKKGGVVGEKIGVNNTQKLDFQKLDKIPTYVQSLTKHRQPTAKKSPNFKFGFRERDFLSPATGSHICPRQHKPKNRSPRKVPFLSLGSCLQRYADTFERVKVRKQKKCVFCRVGSQSLSCGFSKIEIFLRITLVR